MKTLISTLSFLLMTPSAMALAPMSSMQPYYDDNAKMCRQKPVVAAENFDAAAWLLSLAPKKDKPMLASCCTPKENNRQASAQ